MVISSALRGETSDQRHEHHSSRTDPSHVSLLLTSILRANKQGRELIAFVILLLTSLLISHQNTARLLPVHLSRNSIHTTTPSPYMQMGRPPSSQQFIYNNPYQKSLNSGIKGPKHVDSLTGPLYSSSGFQHVGI